MATRPKTDPVFDRTPPHDIDAERAVLGAMLLDADAIGAAIEILRENPAEVFYAPAHQHLYSAMMSLYRSDTAVDSTTLVYQLNRDGTLEEAGGASYVAELTSAVPTSANIEHYARIVLDAAVLRRTITVCTRVIGKAYEAREDVNELLDSAESDIFAIAEKRQLNPIQHVGELLKPAVEKIESIIKSHKGITGIATGFARLDELLSGLQASDMIILAARPSVGKTALALNMARHVAVHDSRAVLIFSLEMAKEQLVQRMICMEGQIDSGKLRTGFLARQVFSKLQVAAGKLDTAPIYIDDTPNISILELRSKARRHASQHALDLIIIDYLQLMNVGGRRLENRQQEISEISRAVKGLARELKVPVLALSQLSREAEKDDSGVPKLSHLRESGAIEQDADVVLMLSRMAGEETEHMHQNKIRLDVAKQRNGPTGVVQLLFDKPMQRFGDLVEGGAVRNVEEPPPGVGEYEPDTYDTRPVDDGEDDVPF
ncbi:MAG TPA: replicative DNA helicase [Candidatus Hydrogenedentes bacterium]|nr:replicative DNA helicase [FCB group bacterium]HNV20235.1 replicative DNA helicase [Candidatus Hydrogenedentota bacterium]HNZ19153.1 replicative DNA helicase [Candidatus Hydrogenedentota bacterium]HOH34568.1 replicative DNA helicase [Candidatus Hydrogenedentota bacterium]HPA03314.1 replicative DNA helicase [Candidatus Hydrogenedentota bacterium]